MKKTKFLLIATILTGIFYGFTLSSSIINPEKDKLLLEVLAYVLEQMTLSDVSVINKIALGDTIVTGGMS